MPSESRRVAVTGEGSISTTQEASCLFAAGFTSLHESIAERLMDRKIVAV